MITLDPVTFTILILLAVVVAAITLDSFQRRSYREGRREGEEVGELRERALWWERTAVAQSRIEALADAASAEERGAEWELPESKM
ncbi:MAG TPA: hypothetical protein VJZ77_11660 [Blastocatellia bacterium]|nr:hypothetical protein [Blastocatellia bacterium]